jgi:hypothetical protein
MVMAGLDPATSLIEARPRQIIGIAGSSLVEPNDDGE